MKLSKPCGALCLALLLTTIFYSPLALGLTNDGAVTNADTASDTQVAPTPAPEHPSAPRFSTGVQEVLKMVEAKVDPEVIKAYIKNSTVPYNLSAADIIDLKKQGVSDDILAALLQRSAEIRAQATTGPVMPGSTSPPGYQANPYPYAYPSDYSEAPYYTDYPYSYSYPYNYWWYTYGYPWGGYYYYWPYYFYGHNHFHGHDHVDHHGHGDFHNGFHGQGSFNHANQASSSPFGTFNGRSSGFSGNRAMSPFSPFMPQHSGFARAPQSFHPVTGFSAPRAPSFSAARPAAFASHVGGFRAGGGFASRGGGGGHR